MAARISSTLNGSTNTAASAQIQGCDPERSDDRNAGGPALHRRKAESLAEGNVDAHGRAAGDRQRIVLGNMIQPPHAGNPAAYLVHQLRTQPSVHAHRNQLVFLPRGRAEPSVRRVRFDA